jgi:hypothetical protein
MPMKPIIFSCLAATLLLSCNETKKATNTSEMETSQTAGYTSLFDGQTLAGWRTYQNKPADSWTVKDGTLYCKGSTTDKSDRRADLITTGQYENFDLSLDWKISPQGNSGIMYLVTEEYPAAYLSGPEYQLIDDNNFPEKLEDWQKTAANYAMDAAPTAQPKPVGEWNHTRIVVNNGHVEHWLNGTKVVDYQLWTDDWKAKKTTGKWKDAAGYALSKKGHIALQDHGSEAWFKNIKIKEL